MLSSLYGRKASAKPTEPILFKFVQNLYFGQEISLINLHFGKKSKLLLKVVFVFGKLELWAFIWGTNLKIVVQSAHYHVKMSVLTLEG